MARNEGIQRNDSTRSQGQFLAKHNQESRFSKPNLQVKLVLKKRKTSKGGFKVWNVLLLLSWLLIIFQVYILSVPPSTRSINYLYFFWVIKVRVVFLLCFPIIFYFLNQQVLLFLSEGEKREINLSVKLHKKCKPFLILRARLLESDKLGFTSELCHLLVS